MLIIISKVSVIFLLLLLGVFSYKKNILPEESRKHFISLLMNFCSPALVLYSMYSVSLTSDLIFDVSTVLIGSALYFFLGTIFALLVIKVFKMAPKEDHGVFLIAMVSINTGFMGFPVSKSIFGEEIFFFFVIQNIVLNIYIFGLVPIICKLGSGKSTSIKGLFKPLLNPAMIATALGFTLLVLGIRPPDVINDFLVMIGDITVPLSMIIIGIQLAQSNITGIIKNKNIILTTVISMAVIPLLVFFAVYPLDFLSNAVKITLVFTSVFPSAVMPAIIVEQNKRNSQFVAEGVSVTTLISMLTIPIWAMLLSNLYL